MDLGQKILFAFSIAILGSLLYFGGCQKTRREICHNVGNTGCTKRYVVGTSADFPPFSYRDEGGTIIGFDIDVIEAIAKEANIAIEIRDLPFDLLIPEIQLNNIDIIAAGMTATPDRSKRVHFAEPHLQGDPFVIVSRAHNPINTTSEFVGKTVVVNEGYTADTFVSAIQGVDVLRLSSVAEALLALQNGRADAFVTASNTIKQLQDRSSVVVSEIPGTAENAALAVSYTQPELYDLINKAVIKLKQNGIIVELKKKWGIS